MIRVPSSGSRRGTNRPKNSRSFWIMGSGWWSVAFSEMHFLLLHPQARRRVARSDFLERHFTGAANLSSKLTARREGAARQGLRQVGRQAGNGVEIRALGLQGR